MKIGILRWKGNDVEVLIKGDSPALFRGFTIDDLVTQQPLLSQGILLVPEDRLIDAFVFLQRTTLAELARGENTVEGLE